MSVKQIEEVQVKTEIISVSIKEEPEWVETEWPTQAHSDLYAGHEVKQEMVIGIEALQPADAAFKTVIPLVDKTYKQEAVDSDGEKTDTEGELLKARTECNSGNKERVVSQKGKYVCNICHKTFALKKRLISHIQSHERKPFFCTTCDKVIHKRSELDHQRIHAREYTCKHCQKRLVSLHSLIRHERTHTGEKPHACDICSKRFKCTSSLNKHKRTHTSLKNHACDVCEKRFKEISQLRIHELIHKGESAKRFACKLCPVKFTHKYKLALHERSHTGELPHACDTCQKTFTHKFYLDAHIRLHTGDKPFTCDTCDKSFRLKSVLRKHLITHSGIKPYPCDVCGRRFTQKPHLSAHKSVHAGEKSLPCEKCDKRFSNRRYLVKHVQRIHVTEKRIYACDQCEKQFERACYLAIHLKSHLNRAPGRRDGKYACDVCSKEFGNKHNLNRHTIAIHGQEMGDEAS